MKKIKSLSQQVRWQLTLLAIGLFLASLVLISLFSFHAIETTTKNLIKLEAESIVRNALENPDLPLPVGEMDAAYRQWSDIPAVIRRLFVNGSIEHPPETGGEILEATRLSEDGRSEYFYFHHHTDDEFGDLFQLSRHDAADIEVAGFRFFTATLVQSFWSTFVIFVLLFFLIRWLIRRTSEPLVLLSQWAWDLGNNPQLPLKTDFPIRELNQLAAQLREGVDKIETYNRREQEFLRYASHELRTPLGIIQASLDTLQLQAGDDKSKPLARALKASDNVRQLSATLLWLARESSQPIVKSLVDLPKLIEQTIDHHRHLLLERDVDIQVNCAVDSLFIEQDLFAIVLSNLLRNAFQHSSGSNIEIAASANQLKITNTNKELNTQHQSNDNTFLNSFGLGLQLVQRICQKLSWQFEFNENANQVSVFIRWQNDGQHIAARP